MFYHWCYRRRRNLSFLSHNFITGYNLQLSSMSSTLPSPHWFLLVLHIHQVAVYSSHYCYIYQLPPIGFQIFSDMTFSLEMEICLFKSELCYYLTPLTKYLLPKLSVSSFLLASNNYVWILNGTECLEWLSSSENSWPQILEISLHIFCSFFKI